MTSPHLQPELIRARARRNATAFMTLKSDLVGLRRDAGMTQKDVAELLGISQQAVQKFERYDSDPKVSTLERYADAVGALIALTVDYDCGQSRDQAPTASEPIEHEGRARIIPLTSASRRSARPAPQAGSWVQVAALERPLRIAL